MDSGLDFIRFNPRTTPQLVDPLIACYQEVFSDHPWHEWKKCPTCSMSWGRKDEEELVKIGFKHCDTQLDDYWKTDDLRVDLSKEISDDASCWLTLDRGSVVGFCWGYSIPVDELDSKIGIPGIGGKIRAMYGVSHVAYQDDMGILASHRGRHLASAMYWRRHQDFLQKGLRIGIVRTKRSPPSVTYLWFMNSLGYDLVGEYSDPNDHRVILGKDLNRLVSPMAQTS